MGAGGRVEKRVPNRVCLHGARETKEQACCAGLLRGHGHGPAQPAPQPQATKRAAHLLQRVDGHLLVAGVVLGLGVLGLALLACRQNRWAQALRHSIRSQANGWGTQPPRHLVVSAPSHKMVGRNGTEASRPHVRPVFLMHEYFRRPTRRQRYNWQRTATYFLQATHPCAPCS